MAATLELARDLVVVTNGLDTFNALVGKPGITASLSGGSQEPRTGSPVGPMAVRAAESFLYDAFICSAAALDHEVGSSEASLAESEVKRAFSQTSGRVILAVDHTKLGTRAQARMFDLENVDLLATDLDPDDGRLDAYRPALNSHERLFVTQRWRLFFEGTGQATDRMMSELVEVFHLD